MACASAGAQPAAQPAAQSAAQKVEITAPPTSDTDQRRRDPVAKTIYGREELDKQGDSNVADVLKRLPGIQVQGGSPRMRGLGSNYTLLLVNGEPAPPGFSLDQLSPNQVERIEVTRGPSAEYSAQAVAGTINIVLREAPRTRQREVNLRSGYQAVRPTLGGNASWGDRVGDFSFTVPLSLYQWRGEAATAGSRSAVGTDGLPQRLRSTGADGYWGGGFNLGPRLSWKLGEADTLSWQSFVQKTRFNNRGVTATEVLQGQAPISVDDRFVSGGDWQMLRSGLQWNHKGADGSRLELKGGFQASSSRSSSRTDGNDVVGLATLQRDSSNHNVERSATAAGKWSLPLGQSHTLALGWDVERRHRSEERSVVENGQDLLPGIEGLPFRTALTRTALFAQDEWELAPRWSTSLGLRVERINTSSSGITTPVASSSQVITPLWHLTHKLNAAGRDLVRASLTRSYKAPELTQLSSRPNINTAYQLPLLNPEIAPDSVGNPALKPELATGLDLAFEHYLPQGGVISVGGFHRRITGLIRQYTSLQTVDWGSGPVQRYVAMPVNLAGARSTGVELELKGRGDELLPEAEAGSTAAALRKGLSLRAAFSVYRSSVDGIPGPDDRLAQQQPWSANLGVDQALAPLIGGVPLTLGASLAWTPGYRTQQSPTQALHISRLRVLDVYALWVIDRQTSLRLSGNNLLADGTANATTLLAADGSTQAATNSRSNLRGWGLGLTHKF